jgi:hypothetical protein
MASTYFGQSFGHRKFVALLFFLSAHKSVHDSAYLQVERWLTTILKFAAPNFCSKHARRSSSEIYRFVMVCKYMIRYGREVGLVLLW